MMSVYKKIYGCDRTVSGDYIVFECWIAQGVNADSFSFFLGFWYPVNQGIGFQKSIYTLEVSYGKQTFGFIDSGQFLQGIVQIFQYFEFVRGE